MLYGKVIFIKKGGGDGSTYPVKERSVLIGSSEKCSIRIYNYQVAPQHCQLIADDKGQVKLRNFSDITYLNDKLLNIEDVTLCHGDIIKIGDRLARWEYFPSSKYYRQLLSPSGRLVAVVMPQQRSEVFVPIPGTSAGHSSPLLGTKRRNSEKIILEGGSTRKVLRATSDQKISNGIKNMVKIISGRRSYQTSKMLFSPKIKMRKSTSCINSSKMSVLNGEKKSKLSLLPWQVNPISPPSVRRSNQRKSTPIKQTTTLKLTKIVRNSSLAKNLNTIEESPLNESENTKRRTRSISKSPKGQQSFATLPVTPKAKINSVKAKLIKSESNLSLKKITHSKKLSQAKRRLSLGTSYGEISKKSPLRKENSQKKSASALNLLSKNVKNNNVNSPTKLSNAGIKLSRNSPRKIQTFTSEKTTFSSSKSRRSYEKKSPTRTSTRILSPKQSTTPSKEVVKESKSKSVEKKKLKGIRRTRSPLTTSAERAAKKLKISSPSKPDKNKKAALLVLGKANRKHMLAQNMKVLLKQKIVKKAIKQSTVVPEKKDLKVEQFSSKQNKKKQCKATNKKRSNRKVLTIRKGINTKISKVSSGGEKKESNNRFSSTKKALLLEDVSKDIKNSETSLSPGKIISAKEITPKSLKIKLPETSSESSKKSKSKNVYSAKTSEPSTILKKSPENYIFNSSRRCSKRLSSKNDISKPDFMELSPTALGLIPKNIEVFKTPKQIKRRRSISLATPKNSCLTGIVKSTSTSKLGHTKTVRFSSKDLFDNSENFEQTSQSTSFDFDNIHTPNITLEVFVSPLSQKGIDKYSSSSKKRKHSDIALKNFQSIENESKSIKCARKLLQSPQSESSPKKISSPIKSSLKTMKTHKSLDDLNLSNNSNKNSPKLKSVLQSRTSPNKRNSAKKVETPLKSKNSDSIVNGVKITQIKISPKSKLNKKNDLKGISQLAEVPSGQKNLRSSLNRSSLNLKEATKISTFENSDAKGNRQYFGTSELKKRPSSHVVNIETTERLSKAQKGSNTRDISNVVRVKTPRAQKSPKNELNDLRGVRELFSQKTRKSPRNDLNDVAGVKKLLRIPRENKSPKNDLSNVGGVKKLLKTPRVQKGPKNELNDLRGVKELFLEKTRNSPKNDLSNVSGVKKLLKTPRTQKSPKNDLTDVVGVKKLLRTPKENKSPKNDLSNVSGVKKLLRTPRLQKSPKNELNDLRGVKELFLEKTRKSPKNDLTDVAGVKKLLRTPKENKSPKNDLSNVSGVKKLLRTPRLQKSPKNELNDLRGVKELFLEKTRNSPKNDLSNVSGVKKLLKTPRTQKSPKNDLTDVAGVKKLLRTPRENKSPKNNLSNVSGVKKLLRTPRAQKSPKNELNDLRGVKELFLEKTRKSPKNELNDLRGVKELFLEKTRKSPKNDLSDLEGVERLIKTPRLSKSSTNDFSDINGIKELLKSPGQQKSPQYNLHVFKESVSRSFDTFHSRSSGIRETEVKQLLVTKDSFKGTSRSKVQSSAGRFPINDYRQIKGRRMIYSTSNNFSPNAGERLQLFTKVKPTNDLNISFTGVAELFDLGTKFHKFSSEIKKSEDNGRLTRKQVLKSTSSSEKSTSISKDETIRKRGRPRLRAASPTLRKSTRKEKEVLIDNKTEGKKGKIVKSVTIIESSETNKKVDESRRNRKLKLETSDSTESSKKQVNSRSRSVSANSKPSPPKLRRKQTEDVVATKVPEEKIKMTTNKKKVTSEPKKAVTDERTGMEDKKSTKAKKTLPKVQSKVSSKSTQKVQKKGSQTGSKKEKANSPEKLSPVKTRSARKVVAATAQKEVKDKAQTKKAAKAKAAKGVSAKKTKSPIATRSLRKR